MLKKMERTTSSSVSLLTKVSSCNFLLCTQSSSSSVIHPSNHRIELMLVFLVRFHDLKLSSLLLKAKSQTVNRTNTYSTASTTQRAQVLWLPWVMSARFCHNHMHSFMIFVYSYTCPTGQKLGSPYLQASGQYGSV